MATDPRGNHGGLNWGRVLGKKKKTNQKPKPHKPNQHPSPWFILKYVEENSHVNLICSTCTCVYIHARITYIRVYTYLYLYFSLYNIYSFEVFYVERVYIL